MEEPKKDMPFIFEDTQNSGGDGRGRFIRAILPILVIVIVIELILGAKTLLSPIPAAGKIIGYGPGEISLISNQPNFKVGDEVAVAIRVSTGGHSTVGTDVLINYDPNYLSAPSRANFLRGQIYTDYPIIDVNNSTGVIKVSGIDSPGQPGFSGIGVLGELIFTARKSGQTTISLSYQKDATNKSNIIENKSAKNILENVYNTKVNINGGGLFSSSQAVKNPTCSPRQLTVCTDDQGRVGSNWCTNIKDPLICQIGCFTEKSGDQVGCKVVSSPIGGAQK